MSEGCTRSGHEPDDVCECAAQPTLYGQSLSEMDFERGIWSAAIDGELDRVRKYLDKGGDPDIIDSSGYTALIYASRSGHHEVCKLLLTAGANANAKTRSGLVTPLHRAAYCGHLKVVQLLLQHKADPTMCDSDGQNPLHKACARGNTEIAKLLLATNEVLTAKKDNRGKQPIDCVSSDKQDLYQLLVASNHSR